VDELRDLIRQQADLGQAIYPQGGSTSLDFGGRPGRPGVAIETGRLSQVVDYPHADMTITVQAGMTTEALQHVLAEHRQRLLIDVPQAGRATLGGVFATNTFGPRRFGLGRTRDQIIGVSFVNAEGVEIKGGGRVVKNVAGYDLPKLMTGALGTLGILTQLTLKVRPIPEASAIVWMPLAGVDQVDSALETINRSDSQPVAIELMNRRAARHIGEDLGLPLADWVIAAGIEDIADSVRWQIERLKAELPTVEMTVLERPDSEPLWSALTEYPASFPSRLGCVATLRPSSLANLLARVDPAAWSIKAHAGNGIVRLDGLADWPLDRAFNEVKQLRAMVKPDGGTVTIPRCPTSFKDELLVWGEPRADWSLSKKIKQAMDPRGVFNPGRFVDSL
jgi:glycolate oxidase FAD binding subunit